MTEENKKKVKESPIKKNDIKSFITPQINQKIDNKYEESNYSKDSFASESNNISRQDDDQSNTSFEIEIETRNQEPPVVSTALVPYNNDNHG